MKRWYVVQAKSNQEIEAAEKIEELGIRTYVPVIHRSTKQLKGSKSTASKVRPTKVFPGYLFVQFNVRKDPWQRICRAPEVLGVLPLGHEHPSPLMSNAVTMIKSIVADLQGERAEALAALTRFVKGQVVKITGGHLAGQTAEFVDSDANRASLLYACLGTVARVHIALSLIAPGPKGSSGAQAVSPY